VFGWRWSAVLASAVTLSVGLYTAIGALLALRIWRAPEQFRSGEILLLAGPTGLVVESPDTRAEFRWRFVSAVRRAGRWLVLWVGPSQGLVIPRRAFATRDEERAFVAAVEAWRRDPQDAPLQAPPDPPLREA